MISRRLAGYFVLKDGSDGTWHHSEHVLDCVAVSAAAVDEYLRSVAEPKRSTLRALRRTILEIVPDAEQVISYRVPAFRVDGKAVAGFAAFKNHLSYLPFSGSVLGPLADELEGYTMTKGSLHFPVDRPPPKSVVKRLIAARLAEIRHQIDEADRQLRLGISDGSDGTRTRGLRRDRPAL